MGSGTVNINGSYYFGRVSFGIILFLCLLVIFIAFLKNSMLHQDDLLEKYREVLTDNETRRNEIDSLKMYVNSLEATIALRNEEIKRLKKRPIQPT